VCVLKKEVVGDAVLWWGVKETHIVHFFVSG